MKKNFSYALIALGFIPFLIKLPYMVNAWFSSRLDQFDACFIILFLFTAAAALAKAPADEHRYPVLFGAVLTVGGAIFAAGFLKEINALSIVGSIVFAWAMFGLVRGWSGAWHLMPAFGILMLSCSSSTYLFATLTGLDGLHAKIFTAILLLCWQASNIIRQRVPVIESVFFAAAALMLFCLYLFGGARYETFSRCLPDVSLLRSGEFLGRVETPSDDDFRFFGTSRIERRMYAGDGERMVQMLAVCEFDDVHNIHPAGHCMRTRGYSVLSERLHQTQLNNGKVQVTELITQSGGETALFWVWYSTPNYSSGSFLFFRAHYRADQQWHTYQIATSINSPGDVEEGRQTFIAFLNALNSGKTECKHRSQHP